MRRRFYNIAHLLLSPVFTLLFLKKAEGLENLPAEGGFVICANHLSACDPVFLASRLPRKCRLHFLAKKELFDIKLLKPLIVALGAIPVDRGHADIGAIRASMQVLKDGCGLTIFPQGTRSRDNSPTPMLPGASMIALRAGTPVIPAYIDGPYRLFRRARVCFGAPIDFSDFGRRCDKDTLEAATGRIAGAVWGMQAACREDRLRRKKEKKKG